MVSNGGQLALLNMAEGQPTSDLRVRRALDLAIDPESMGERATSGVGFYSKSIFSPLSKWYDEDAQVNPYDPDEARKLLEEAKADGFDGKLTLIGPDSQLSRADMLALKAQWDAVGFDTTMEPVRNIADFIAKMYVDRDFQTAHWGWQVVDNDPWQNLYSGLHSQAASNLSNMKDPEMDALLDELRATPLTDEAAARDVLRRFETHFYETIPGIMYRSLTPTTAWSSNVYGVIGLNEGMSDYGKAWIKP